ncbi:MAG TPA: DUF805 domain-containing protein [Steroidobacteraceae bacterium]|nr:DUF805 domain-containing protein [Steroidobacteraceae bacterium]
MKYVVWLIRLWYAAWMIPAGLEHFVHIFPQPGYYTTRPLAHEMLFALLDSHLFDVVKGVELLTGIAVLLGFFTPLMLLVCMPVAFCVFWWDAPLSTWNYGSVLAGGRVLASNVLLCVAFIGCFRAMFPLRPTSPTLRQLVLVGRTVFGAWMLISGANYFFFSLWALPTGHEPLAVELMGAFAHSGLLTVAILIELVTGALLLTGVFAPAALCVVMPTSTCAVYWALLEHQPLPLLLALLAFALNGLLMLAYLDYYRGALQRCALTLGESGQAMTWDSLFVHSKGRTPRDQFIGALIPLAIVVWWYARANPTVYPQWSLLVLLFPAIVLHARRLHDMGHSGWLLIVPAVLTAAAMMIWDHRLDLGTQLNMAVPLAALIVFVGLALWGCIGKGKTQANAFGPPAMA